MGLVGNGEDVRREISQANPPIFEHGVQVINCEVFERIQRHQNGTGVCLQEANENQLGESQSPCHSQAGRYETGGEEGEKEAHIDEVLGEPQLQIPEN